MDNLLRAIILNREEEKEDEKKKPCDGCNCSIECCQCFQNNI